jgi:hypothetical protein
MAEKIANQIFENCKKLFEIIPPANKFTKINKSVLNVPAIIIEEENRFYIDYAHSLKNLSESIHQLFTFLFLPHINPNNPRSSKFDLYQNPETKEVEYEFVQKLISCLLILETYSIRNSEASSNWSKIRFYEHNPDSNVLQKKRSSVFSLRTNLFKELCKIRVMIYCFSLPKRIAREKNRRTELFSDFPFISACDLGMAIKSSDTILTDESKSLWMRFLKEERISSPIFDEEMDKEEDSMLIEKTKPILMYNQHELDESFKLLFYKWNMVNYNIQLELYVQMLLTRVAFFVAFENMGVEYIDRPALYKQSEFFNEKEFEFGGLLADRFFIKFDLRYYYTIVKLHRLNCQRIIMSFDTTRLSYLIEPSPKDISGDDKVMYEFLANRLKNWMYEWANGQMGIIGADNIKKKHLKLLLPPGDKEWLQFDSKSEALTVTNIIAKLHPDKLQDITSSSDMKPSEIIGTTSNIVKIQRLHDKVVLRAIESIFSEEDKDISKSFSFYKTFMISEKKEILNFNNINNDQHMPFLAYCFSRIHIHFHTNSLYKYEDSSLFNEMKQEKASNYDTTPFSTDMLCNLYGSSILTALVSDKTIYHVVSHFLLIMKKLFPDSGVTKHLWDRVYKLIYA